MEDNYLEMEDGLYLRTIGPFFITDKFPDLPGVYCLNGPWKSVVRVSGCESGAIIITVLLDPKIAKEHQVLLDKYQQDLEKWPEMVRIWESTTDHKMGFFKTERPKEPVPPPKMGIKIAVLYADDKEPFKVRGTLTPIGVVDDTHFFNVTDELEPPSDFFGRLLGR
jgi:hypothetical protein